jgi:hypothetical protein
MRHISRLPFTGAKRLIVECGGQRFQWPASYSLWKFGSGVSVHDISE